MTRPLTNTFELFLEPDEELAPRDAVVLDVADIRKCKIVTSIKQTGFGQYDGNRACLTVFEFHFVPHYQVRFKYVEVVIRATKPKSQGGGGGGLIEQPTVIAFEPKSWFGRRDERIIRRSLQAGANAGMLARSTAGVESGPGLGGSMSVEYAEADRAAVVSVPGQATTEWRLSENDLSHEGVPNPFSAALILKCGPSFAVRVGFRVKLSKSLDPTSWRPAQARTTDLLTFDAETVSQWMRAPVSLIDNMEDERFDLGSFITTDWDL